MKSYEVIRGAAERVGVKQVAAEMNLSTSLIYKWCQNPGEPAGDEASGAINPLDRMAALWDCTRDIAMIDWLCQRAGGTFVPNPLLNLAIDAEYVERVQQMIRDFSELLGTASQSMIDDGKVDPKEAEKLRREWQQLKRDAEAFVLACERGLFGGKKP